MIKIFGIRHHGPGSARALNKAFREWEPDCIIIEGPVDAENIIHHVADEGLVPPVAILAYNPKNTAQASYFPFAKFSPEWNAIKYGLKNDVPVRFMDLPQGIHFGLDEQAEQEKQISLETPEKETNPEGKSIIHDPIGYAAKIAGYPDGERWWEITFEQQEGHAETFEAVQELMTALREGSGKTESPRTLLREAHMRKIIRKAEKEGFEKIAVVCGAWHGPVLGNPKDFKTTEDNKLLRGLKKVRIKATWVPWSYDRLAVSSGYGAGVISPAWYDMLFGNRKNVSIRWMTKAARLFRNEDLDASSAHVIDAVRLSETLASLRGLSVPGMNELYEAALTQFCGGYESPMELIERKLIIGDIMGKVSENIPVIPLQSDLEKQIKSARLTKFRNSLEPEERSLDLRQDSQLAASRLLHRMNILGIKWGKVKESKRRFYGRTQGDFKEHWKLRWRPDFAIRIIEAGMWGNTVESAASLFLRTEAADATELAKVTRLISLAIKGNLPDTMDDLMRAFQAASAVSNDIPGLMEAVPELIEALKYANTRQADLGALEKQLNEIIPRICIGLPGACSSLNEEASAKMFSLISGTDYQISLLENPSFNTAWVSALSKVSENETINGLIRGGALRLLYDKKSITPEEARQGMSQALSIGNDHADAAYWLSGFLHGSGLILIHDPALWNVLDHWVNTIDVEALKKVLPVIRRTFSKFPNPEKESMMALAKQGKRKEAEALEISVSSELWNESAAEKVMPTLRLLLGLG